MFHAIFVLPHTVLHRGRPMHFDGHMYGALVFVDMPHSLVVDGKQCSRDPFARRANGQHVTMMEHVVDQHMCGAIAVLGHKQRE